MNSALQPHSPPQSIDVSSASTTSLSQCEGTHAFPAKPNFDPAPLAHWSDPEQLDLAVHGPWPVEHGHSAVQALGAQVHVRPSPVYPDLHVQVNAPTVFAQRPLAPQLCVPLLHSSTS